MVIYEFAMLQNDLLAIVEEVNHEVENGLGAPQCPLAALHGNEQHLVRRVHLAGFLIRRMQSVVVDAHMIVNAHAKYFIDTGGGTHRQPYHREGDTIPGGETRIVGEHSVECLIERLNHPVERCGLGLP